MDKNIGDFFKVFRSLSNSERHLLKEVDQILEKRDFSKLKYLLKIKKIQLTDKSFGISEKLVKDILRPFIKAKIDDKDIKNAVEEWNEAIEEKFKLEAFKQFSEIAETNIIKLIAPNIIGLDEVKEAAALQLFSDDSLHILLLGDPGTGKTDILRSIYEMSPISSFGLGSGTSGAGLSLIKQGKAVIKGLLPLANNGICCIDELNLMKKEDRGSLLNAMEKGFVTYDKGTTHIKMDAKISVLATANPTGDKFIGKNADLIKKQLPFDPALISRFHLVFLIRKPGTEEFVNIAKKIIRKDKVEENKADYKFIKDYVDFSRKIDVEFDHDLETEIIEFVRDVKNNENKYIIEVSPRLVLGIIRMVKANARISLRNKVTHKDLKRVLDTLRHSLAIRN